MAINLHKVDAALSGWRACYGVDVQEGRCTAVRAERVHGRVVCSPVDAGAVERLAVEGLPVVTVMSERESFTRWVEAPYASATKARKVFPTLLDIQLPFALDDCVHTFITTTHAEGGGCRGLAAAARRTHVEEKLDSCEARGIDPMVIDQAGLALWSQALREHPLAAAETVRIVVWFDGERLTLVKGRCGAFVSAHTAPADDVERIRHLAGLSADDPDASAATWIWCGPSASEDRIASLWAALGQPGIRHTVDEPAMFLLRAITTRALLAGPYRCNLRCADLTHEALMQRDRRREQRVMVYGLIAAVILAGADALALRMLHARVHAAEHVVVQEVDALAGYHITARGRDALRAVQDAVQERKQTLQPFADAMDPTLMSELMALIEVADTNGIYLDTVSLSAERTEVSGTSPGWTQCEMVLAPLTRAGVSPELKRGDALANERIPFSAVRGGGR